MRARKRHGNWSLMSIMGHAMKLPRRSFLHLAAGAAALPTAARIAQAQTYPTRPVRLIVGFPAGGAQDIVARLMGQWLSERLGQPILIENRPGAGGNIGAEAAVRAVPDGYTLLLAGTPNAINTTLYNNLSFVFLRDITPVAAIVRVPSVMVFRNCGAELNFDAGTGWELDRLDADDGGGAVSFGAQPDPAVAGADG